MYKLIRRLLFKFDPETVHGLALSFLSFVSRTPIGGLVATLMQVRDNSLKQKVFGLEFKNPVGAAAGFDKHAVALNALEDLGFGFVEVGTITRYPQPGNPKPRLFRLEKDKGLINRMGFNSLGSVVMAARLAKYKKLKIPLGVSLGKTKVVPLNEAPEDYQVSFSNLYNFGSYFVINITSPNTPGLRDLAEKEALVKIISRLQEFRVKQNIQKPILVKIVIDFPFPAVDEVLQVCQDCKADGVICSNTSLGRDNLKIEINEHGGLSGKPIQQKSTEYIRHMFKKAPGLPIIGVGGIFSAEDAYEKIKAGASLVQLYTGLIYEGPGLVKKINQGLVKFLERDGFKNISEAVGVES